LTHLVRKALKHFIFKDRQHQKQAGENSSKEPGSMIGARFCVNGDLKMGWHNPYDAGFERRAADQLRCGRHISFA